jgi:hypothetical protein
MAPRLELQDLLIDILGSPNVYFQPPPTIKMVYPCIVYNRDFMHIDYADNKTYSRMKRYQIMVIDPDPDSAIPDKILDLPLCRYERFFTADNLNHDVYELFF